MDILRKHASQLCEKEFPKLSRPSGIRLKVNSIIATGIISNFFRIFNFHQTSWNILSASHTSGRCFVNILFTGRRAVTMHKICSCIKSADHCLTILQLKLFFLLHDTIEPVRRLSLKIPPVRKYFQWQVLVACGIRMGWSLIPIQIQKIGYACPCDETNI